MLERTQEEESRQRRSDFRAWRLYAANLGKESEVVAGDVFPSLRDPDAKQDNDDDLLLTESD